MAEFDQENGLFELRDMVANTLSANGALSKIKVRCAFQILSDSQAQLRASVFLALDNPPKVCVGH